MNSHNLLYEKTFKQFLFGAVSIILSYLTIGVIIYYPLLFPSNYISASGIGINSMALALIYILPISYIHRLLKIYIIVNTAFLSFSCGCFLAYGNTSCLLWIVVLPTAMYTATFGKKIDLWLVFCICFFVMILALAFFLRHVLGTKELILNTTWAIRIAVVDVLSAFALVCWCLYYANRFLQIQTSQLMYLEDTASNNKNKEAFVLGNDDWDNYKYEKIFQQIEEYVAREQPYLKSDFTISQMAYDLNINNAYIAKSISKNKNMNFKSFLNTYRIERVKEMIEDNTASKYTLEYIYLSSGFKGQASFNRVFKLHTGILPSEYHKKIKD